MTGHILQLNSPAIYIEVDHDDTDYSVVIDDWTVAEHRFRGGKSDPPIDGNYRVSLSRELADWDAGNSFIHGEAFATAMERAWLYGTGVLAPLWLTLSPNAGGVRCHELDHARFVATAWSSS